MCIRDRDIALSLVAQLLESRGNSSLQQLLFRDTGGSDHMVTVTDDHRFTTGLVQDVRILGSKSGQLTDGRIFFKDDLAVVAGENFQRVTLADAQGAADFLGNDHTTCLLYTSRCV